MSHFSDSDHRRLDAKVFPDNTVVESDEISDVARGLRRVPVTRVWRTERLLGEGGYGQVHLQFQEGDKDAKRALKIIPTRGMKLSLTDCQRELMAMIEFTKPKYRSAAVFVDFIGWFQTESAMFLAMEYMPLGDLEQNVQAIEKSPAHNGLSLSEEEVQEISRQILEGLKIMHAEGFAHRDLKPQNVFVVQKQPQWWVKLGDFGLSKKRTDETAYRTQAGTIKYMAPEMFYYVQELDPTTSEYTNAVDLWSLGCIIYRIMTGTVPFPDLLSLNKYCRKPYQISLSMPQGMEEASKFVDTLLMAHPAKRPAASAALESSWLTKRNKPKVTLNGLGTNFAALNVSESRNNYNTASHKGLQSQSSMPALNDLRDLTIKGPSSEPLPPLASEMYSKTIKAVPQSIPKDEYKQNTVHLNSNMLVPKPISGVRSTTSSLSRSRSQPGHSIFTEKLNNTSFAEPLKRSSSSDEELCHNKVAEVPTGNAFHISNSQPAVNSHSDAVLQQQGKSRLRIASSEIKALDTGKVHPTKLPEGWLAEYISPDKDTNRRWKYKNIITGTEQFLLPSKPATATDALVTTQTRQSGFAAPRQTNFWMKALFDFDPQYEHDLRFSKGDMIRVTGSETNDQSQNGWLIGEVNGRKGSFPANYCQLAIWMKALYDFDPHYEGDLRLSMGDLILIKDVENNEKLDQGWLLGEVNGRKGVFPVNYCEVVEADLGSETDISTTLSVRNDKFGPVPQLSFITPKDGAKFTQLYKTAAGAQKTLSPGVAKDILLRSGLDMQTLGHIWTLADTTKSGTLYFPEFALAMYLCNLKLDGKTLPFTLPVNIKYEVELAVDRIIFGDDIDFGDFAFGSTVPELAIQSDPELISLQSQSLPQTANLVAQNPFGSSYENPLYENLIGQQCYKPDVPLTRTPPSQPAGKPLPPTSTQYNTLYENLIGQQCYKPDVPLTRTPPSQPAGKPLPPTSTQYNTPPTSFQSWFDPLTEEWFSSSLLGAGGSPVPDTVTSQLDQTQQTSNRVNLSFDVSIRTFQGKIIKLPVMGQDTIYVVKCKVGSQEGYRAERLELMYRGRRLDNHHTLAYYEIQPEDILYSL